MTPLDFTNLRRATYSRIDALNDVKSGEYAKDEDKLANFKEAGQRLGSLPEQVLLVYLDKHYAAICNFVKDLAAHKTRPRSEPIDGRVDDAILYLLLFKALLQERRLTSATISAEIEDNGTLVWGDE